MLKCLQQTVAICGIRETGAIASARAAEIYGLEMLAEKIQVMLHLQFSVIFFIKISRKMVLPVCKTLLRLVSDTCKTAKTFVFD